MLREVAASALPQFRGHPANTSDSDGAAQHIEAISAGELQAVLAGMGQFNRSLLSWLTDHPDERFDGAALLDQVGGDQHSAITLAFANIGQRFRDRGIARPWNEAQRGYLVTADRAARLRTALEQTS